MATIGFIEKDSFEKILSFIQSGSKYSKKILFWPEGTRKSYETFNSGRDKINH